MMLPICSALKARSVLERMLPTDPTRNRATVAVSSSGNSDRPRHAVSGKLPVSHLQIDAHPGSSAARSLYGVGRCFRPALLG
jgi:hypothetical protein